MHYKLSTFIHASIQHLAAIGIDNPQLDARLLIGHALSLERMQLLSQSERLLTQDQITHAQTLLDRRALFEPVARILGEREFWGLPFGLNEATLEPRPDSETLIEATLKRVQKGPLPLEGRVGERGVKLGKQIQESETQHQAEARPPCPSPQEGGNASGNQPLRILDIGTGTGCLLLSLLHELPNATGLGLDIAPRAVEQARQNAERLGLSERATFNINNWLENIDQGFDIIIANPPYIAETEIPTLMRDVRDYDPLRALDGGKDGLDPYRLLIPQLPHLLNKGGLAVFEFGQYQAASVRDLFQQSGFTQIEAHKDLGGIERCMTAHIP